MDERRPDSIPVTPPRRVTPKTSLSPLQKAYGDYVTHALECAGCRDVDGEACAEGDGLFEAYRTLKREQRRAARF